MSSDQPTPSRTEVERDARRLIDIGGHYDDASLPPRDIVAEQDAILGRLAALADERDRLAAEVEAERLDHDATHGANLEWAAHNAELEADVTRLRESEAALRAALESLVATGCPFCCNREVESEVAALLAAPGAGPEGEEKS
jgi:hypothetical protein